VNVTPGMSVNGLLDMGSVLSSALERRTNARSMYVCGLDCSVRWAQRISSDCSAVTSMTAIMWRWVNCTVALLATGATAGDAPDAAVELVDSTGGSSVRRILQFWRTSLEVSCVPPVVICVPAASLIEIASWSHKWSEGMST